MRHRSNLTEGDVEVFVQMMAYFIELGILPTGNKTTALSWTFGNSFITSIIILSTIGYGTVFPITPRGQMFCVVFAAIGIPLTIVLFKYISKLVFLPFEKLGGYLEHNGVSKKYVSLWKIVIFTITGSLVFLLLPPFVFMSLENWTYVEGIYYSFTTISAIGLGDYAIVSNPMKETKSLVYSALLLIWNLHGLVWIALLFNLITEFCYEMESKLNAVSSEIEVGKEDNRSDAQNQCA